MGAGVCSAAEVLRGVNGDIAGPHAAGFAAAIAPLGDEGLGDLEVTALEPGRWSGLRRTRA